MDFIKQQNDKFLNSISLIASENYSFYNAFYDIYNSDLSWRYSFFENSIFQKSFPWHENIVNMQEDITNTLKNKFKSKYLSLSSLSWMNALLSILMSLTVSWDTVYFIPIDCWWHSSSYKIASRLWLNVKYIPFDYNTKKIDFFSFRNQILREMPKLIYIDQMTWIYPISLLEIEDITIPNNIITYNDISHNSAFIISWLHKNPLFDWYSMFWWSTHKTIPWPQKAFIATNNSAYYSKIIESLNFIVSNNNPLNIAILWKVFDIMEFKWDIYTKQILSNSIYFSKQIQSLWFELLYDWETFSQNHQVLFFTEPIIDTKVFFSNLSNIWIYVNILPLPFSNWRIWIRVWLQEFTLLWWKEKDIDLLINLFKDILNNTSSINDNKLKIYTLKKYLLTSFNNNYK